MEKKYKFTLSGKKFAYGFTLIELMMVVFIVGLLAALTIPNYISTREKAYDREAVAALKLILAADRHYFMGREHWYPSGGGTVTNITEINRELALDLDNRLWYYVLQGVPGAPGPGFVASAVRLSGAARNWSIASWMGTEPGCTGTCY